MTSLFLPTWLGVPLCDLQTRVITHSSTPAHFYLIWSLTPPVKTPRYIKRRGGLIKCGFTWTFTKTTCKEQTEQGFSLTHSFLLPTFPVGTVIYYFMSTQCAYLDGAWTSPPVKYTINAPGVGSHTAYGHFIGLDTILTGAWRSMRVNVIDCNPDNIFLASPASGAHIWAAGKYYMAACFFLFTRTWPGSLKTRLFNSDSGVTISETDRGSWPAGSNLVFTEAAFFTAAANDDITWQVWVTAAGTWRYITGGWVDIRKMP